jgi:hypothetical protein
MIVTITVDTEEDQWGSYAYEDASTRNIQHLPALQELFDKHGARPTYLVNRPPLLDQESVAVLGDLSERDSVEVGAHCHPWNTPPISGVGLTMMSGLPEESNGAMIREITTRIEGELGITPRSFRAGRWGFGPTVSRALAREGYQIDCSVSPFIDWTSIGGPDFGTAPHQPYRFDPDDPLTPSSPGSMLELPTTVGFLRGDARQAQRDRLRLEKSVLARFGAVGLMDRAGLLARRWLSPEISTSQQMIQVAAAALRSGDTYISMAFHSCTLMSGATPFVADGHERAEFFRRCDEFLAYCGSAGFRFRTLSEAGRELAPDLVEAPRSS